jgi:hypothetical protein
MMRNVAEAAVSTTDAPKPDGENPARLLSGRPTPSRETLRSIGALCKPKVRHFLDKIESQCYTYCYSWNPTFAWPRRPARGRAFGDTLANASKFTNVYSRLRAFIGAYLRPAAADSR